MTLGFFEERYRSIPRITGVRRPVHCPLYDSRTPITLPPMLSIQRYFVVKRMINSDVCAFLFVDPESLSKIARRAHPPTLPRLNHQQKQPEHNHHHMHTAHRCSTCAYVTGIMGHGLLGLEYRLPRTDRHVSSRAVSDISVYGSTTFLRIRTSRVESMSTRGRNFNSGSLSLMQQSPPLPSYVQRPAQLCRATSHGSSVKRERESSNEQSETREDRDLLLNAEFNKEDRAKSKRVQRATDSVRTVSCACSISQQQRRGAHQSTSNCSTGTARARRVSGQLAPARNRPRSRRCEKGARYHAQRWQAKR